MNRESLAFTHPSRSGPSKAKLFRWMDNRCCYDLPRILADAGLIRYGLVNVLFLPEDRRISYFVRGWILSILVHYSLVFNKKA